MGIFDIFSAAKAKILKPKDSSQLPKGDVSFRQGKISRLSIKSLGFYGLAKCSRSGEWVVGWCTGSANTHQSRSGSYALINLQENALYVMQGSCLPEQCYVADNGNFVVLDRAQSSKVTGELYVFSKYGALLATKSVQANYYNAAISDDGSYVICQTCNSSTKDDSSKLSAIHVQSNTQMFSVNPPTGWADEYEFDLDKPVFGVTLRELGTFFYDATGQFIDAEKFKLAKLGGSSYAMLLMTCGELLDDSCVTSDKALQALNAADKALITGAADDNSWSAVAHKYRGQALQYLGRADEAIVAFEKALGINPRIGVKRALQALKKSQVGKN